MRASVPQAAEPYETKLRFFSSRRQICVKICRAALFPGSMGGSTLAISLAPGCLRAPATAITCSAGRYAASSPADIVLNLPCSLQAPPLFDKIGQVSTEGG